MATVLNRTTFQVLESVHTPDYLVASWVHNPDLSPVSGVDVKYWKLTVDTLSEMTQGEKDTVDAGNLSALKVSRYLEIDTNTGGLIAAGFTYDSKIFSLSISAQTNWNVLKDEELEFTWPVDVSTIDNDTYTLTQANLDAFWAAARDAAKDRLDSGRVLKKSIFDAADTAAVNAVVDAR